MNLKLWFNQHSTQVLTAVGIIGFGCSAILSAKAYKECCKRIDEKCKEEDVETLPAKEIAKICWKPCVMPVLTFTTSAICILGAQNILMKRNAALATAYKITETAYSEFKKSAKEELGEKKFKEIQEQIAQKQVEAKPAIEENIAITSNGSTLCCDMAFGRYFTSSQTAIDRAIARLNNRMFSEMYISLNDFYYEVGLNPVDMGNDIGWNVENGPIEVEYSSALAPNGTPVLCVSYRVAPRTDYINP